MLDAVIDGKCDFAVAPLENTNTGSVFAFQREMLQRKGKVFVADLFQHDVHHFLYSKCALSSVKQVRLFHPTIPQTNKWIAKHLPDAA